MIKIRLKITYYLKIQECLHTSFKANIERTEDSYSKYSSIDDKLILSLLYNLTKFG